MARKIICVDAANHIKRFIQPELDINGRVSRKVVEASRRIASSDDEMHKKIGFEWEFGRGRAAERRS